MKKKGIIVLSLLLIASLILAGCGNGTPDTDTATSEANDSLENLKEGFSDEDETAIANSISDDGVTVVDNIEDSTDDYTKEEFIKMAEGPQSILMLNLINQSSEVNGDTVIIRGESFASFQLLTGTHTTQPASLTIDNSTDSITTQDTYSGTNFSVEYPDNWYSTSISNQDSEILMAIPDGQQKTSLAMWQDDVFHAEFGLDDLMSQLESVFSDWESRTEPPNIDNWTLDYSDNTNYADAKDYTATYDYNYKPIIVEIEMQKEGDTYKITQITVGQSSVKTVSVTEKGIVINKNNDLYLITYGGNDDVYSETEANNIFNSFEIQ